ncbi:Transposase IS200 like protein [Brevibacillus laterosporus]|nr:Transposase IS200 like protein [Brevibacillus laterosporus]
MALSRSVESNNNIVFDCKYHVVFCPKYRKKVLIEPVDVRLKELFLEKAQELRAEVVEMEIMPDHVHLLITCDPQFVIHRIVKHLTGYTSRVVRMEFRHLKSRLPSL